MAELKKLSVEIGNECWKKLKILSIQKEIRIIDVVSDILEKSVSGKKFDLNSRVGVEVES